MKNYIIFNDKKYYPSKVVCIGRNYLEHIEELNNEIPKDMVFFIKPNSAISEDLIFPKKFKSCHYEGELSFLIIDDTIKAISFGLDLTLRQVQAKLKEKGLPWERAKAFDKSAVFSKFVEIKNLDDLKFELYINGKLRQKADISLMINKPYEILKEAQSFLSFEDGDILMSGTPSGVGELVIGDEFIAKIIQKDELLSEFRVNVK